MKKQKECIEKAEARALLCGRRVLGRGAAEAGRVERKDGRAQQGVAVARAADQAGLAGGETLGVGALDLPAQVIGFDVEARQRLADTVDLRGRMVDRVALLLATRAEARLRKGGGVHIRHDPIAGQLDRKSVV